MTYRSLHGLSFKVFSPSLWELCARADDSHIHISLVTLAYNGAHGWNIHVLMKRGHTIIKGPFPSLTAAVQVIAFGAAEEHSNVS
jgi:hypothetical protein